MKSYTVRSGPLKVTIVAPSAYEAALEAVRWWDDSDAAPSGDAGHRAQLDAAIEVRPRSTSRAPSIPRLFPAFKLLARAAGQNQSQAWEQVLRQKVGQSN